MVELVPAPDPHRLLPPVLACLPTAFVSHRPPPAMLPLVSPIIQQRLQLIASTSNPSAENWLRLLCWDPKKADRLMNVVENGTYEPHPSSGEIEVGEVGTIRYKRLDQETLRAQIVLSEWDLIAQYIWCSQSEGEGGWKLAELFPGDSGLKEDPSWSVSINEANESSRERMVSEAIRDAEDAEKTRVEQGDDDDYWAQYDKTPRRSPTQNRTPIPNGTATAQKAGPSESDYYAQYNDVQPAMDNDDPSENPKGPELSSLHGDILSRISEQKAEGVDNPGHVQRKAFDAPSLAIGMAEIPVTQPQPSPPLSSSSGAVALLEGRADWQSASEIGIRQHICTSMKSLYRLAKSAGMEQEEFNRIICRELETNSILEV
jgi:hypothetical protein